MRVAVLAVPPSTNNLYTVVRGRQVLSETGRAFKGAMTAVLADAWGAPVSDGPFAVLLTLHLGAYDRDADGSHKILLDAASGTVWRDDRRVVLLAVRKRRAPAGVLPYMTLRIRPMAAAPRFAPLPRRDGSFDFDTTLMPPSANNSYAVVRGSRRKTEAARRTGDAYQAGFADLAGNPASPLFAGPVAVRLRFGFAADRRDVDGSHKLLLDAARGILWGDDRQIASFSVAKGRVAAGAAPSISGAVFPLAR